MCLISAPLSKPILTEDSAAAAVLLAEEGVSEVSHSAILLLAALEMQELKPLARQRACVQQGRWAGLLDLCKISGLFSIFQRLPSSSLGSFVSC